MSTPSNIPGERIRNLSTKGEEIHHGPTHIMDFGEFVLDEAVRRTAEERLRIIRGRLEANSGKFIALVNRESGELTTDALEAYATELEYTGGMGSREDNEHLRYSEITIDSTKDAKDFVFVGGDIRNVPHYRKLGAKLIVAKAMVDISDIYEPRQHYLYMPEVFFGKKEDSVLTQSYNYLTQRFAQE